MCQLAQLGFKCEKSTPLTTYYRNLMWQQEIQFLKFFEVGDKTCSSRLNSEGNGHYYDYFLFKN